MTKKDFARYYGICFASVALGHALFMLIFWEWFFEWRMVLLWAAIAFCGALIPFLLHAANAVMSE